MKIPSIVRISQLTNPDAHPLLEPLSTNAHPIIKFASLMRMLGPDGSSAVRPEFVLRHFLTCEMNGMGNADDLGFYFSDLPLALKERSEEFQNHVWASWKLPLATLSPSQFIDDSRIESYESLQTEAPAVIVVYNANTKSFVLKDGNHRVSVAKAQGRDFVGCFLGISEETIKQWLIEGDPVRYMAERSFRAIETIFNSIQRIENYENKDSSGGIPSPLHVLRMASTLSQAVPVGYAYDRNLLLSRHEATLRLYLAGAPKRTHKKLSTVIAKFGEATSLIAEGGRVDFHEVAKELHPYLVEFRSLEDKTYDQWATQLLSTGSLLEAISLASDRFRGLLKTLSETSGDKMVISIPNRSAMFARALRKRNAV